MTITDRMGGGNGGNGGCSRGCRGRRGPWSRRSGSANWALASARAGPRGDPGGQGGGVTARPGDAVRHASRSRPSPRLPRRSAPAAQAASTPSPCPGAEGWPWGRGLLDREPGAHRPDLLQVPVPAGSTTVAASIGNRNSRPSTMPIAAAESRTRVATPRAEQGDQAQVQRGAEGRAQVGAVPQRQRGPARPVAGQDELPGQHRPGRADGPGGQHQAGDAAALAASTLEAGGASRRA